MNNILINLTFLERKKKIYTVYQEQGKKVGVNASI